MAQSQNLVGNPGFETFSSLPTNYGQYALAIGWGNCGGAGTSDYFHTSGTVGTFFGQIAPNSGAGQMGFLTRHSSAEVAMEYNCRTLNAPMIAGTTYEVSFYLTRGNGSGGYTSATGNIGAYFSVGLPTQAGGAIIPVTPQVEQVAIVNVVNSWQQFYFTFTPTAAFNSIVIGNFRSFAATPFSGGSGNAYYFIDDIVVQPVVILNQELIYFNAEKYRQNQALLRWRFEQTQDVLYIDVQRSSDAMEFENIASGLTPDTEEWIDPNPFEEMNYYRLRSVSVDGTISYSEVKALRFDPSAGISLSGISPNPFREWLVLSLQNLEEEQQVNLKIFDLNGRLVHSEAHQIPQGKIKIELSLPHDLPAGAYMLAVESEKTASRKMYKIIRY